MPIIIIMKIVIKVIIIIISDSQSISGGSASVDQKHYHCLYELFQY